jgi:hypothetical protein
MVGNAVLDSASSRFTHVAPAICSDLQLAQALSEAGGRLWLLISALALVAVACGTLTFAAWDTLCVLSRRGFVSVLVGLLSALVAATIIHTLGICAGLFLPAIDKLGPGVVAAAEKCSGTLGGPGFQLMALNRLIDLVSAIAVIASAIIIFATIACLAESPAPQLDLRERVRIWKWQSHRAERFLKLGAALLVVGLVCHICWTMWPDFLFKRLDGKKGELVDSQTLKSYHALVNAFAGYKATHFTILLASFYLPVAIVLSQRANSMAREHWERERPPDQLIFVAGEVREKLGLAPNHHETMKSVAAILAPIATGLLAQVLQVAAK